MKRAKILPAMLLLLNGACGAEEEATIAPVGEPASVSLTASADLPAPLHGGTVLMAGERPIEVVADEEGAFKAYYLGAAPPAPAEAQVTVRVPDAEGEIRPVVLTWDPGAAHYAGRLRGALPVPGPLEVVVVIDGQRARATAPTFVLVEPATTVIHAERPAANVDVQVRAPSAPSVVVEAPRPPSANVVVHAPRPPSANVVVHAPRPPSANVVVHAPRPPRARVVVEAPTPPRPRVVVEAPSPPRVRVRAERRRGSVTVRAPERRRGSVRVRAPSPRPRVIVRDNDDHPGHRRGRGHQRGRGRGHDHHDHD